MRKLKLHTSGLTCSLEDRTLTGTALPYGEPGRTSLGLVTATKDSGVKLADRIIGNMEHDRTRPVAVAASHKDTAKGLTMTFAVAKTTAGDDLLAEVDAGLRTGLSVEVDEPVIRAGKLMGGSIAHVAFCTDPAFDSARLTATAADTPDDDEEPDEEADAEPDVVVEVTTDDADTEDDADPATASKPKGSALVGAARTKSRAIKTVAEFSKMMATARPGSTLLAALADITQSGVGSDVAAQGFLGELWSGVGYTRQYVPALTHEDLVSWETHGWRWVTKPEVADYTGDKAAVPSNTVDTEAASTTASRLAGAHDIDRRFYDFPDGGPFIASYLAAMAESYALKSDLKALAFILASGHAATAGVIPTAGNSAVFGVLDAILDVKTRTRQLPDTVIIGAGVFRNMAGQTQDGVLALLQQRLSLTDGQVAGVTLDVGGPDFPEGQVAAIVRKAGRFLELPGSPIRVSATNIANGGQDEGLFGYYATFLDDADGIALLTVVPTSINSGADFAMTVGDPNHTVTVLATGTDGGIYDVTTEAVLTSATPAKATIVGNKVHPVAAGTSVITATYGTKTDTSTVTVS